MAEDSNYGGTSIGFITNNKDNKTVLGSRRMGQAFSSASSFLDRAMDHKSLPGLAQLNFIDKVPGKHLMAAFLVSAAAFTAAQPEIVGAAVGDFSRARAEALQGKTYCEPQQKCTGIERLGEFSGNLEKRFEQGHRDGLKQTLRRTAPPQ